MHVCMTVDMYACNVNVYMYVCMHVSMYLLLSLFSIIPWVFSELEFGDYKMAEIKAS